MRRLAALTLLFVLALAEKGPEVVVVNQTHVFHTPIPMTEVVGALGVQGLGGLGTDLAPFAEVGGFLEYREWRLRMAATGSAGGELCYTGALNWLGHVLEAKTTYRLRAGGGGGLRLCYPLAGEEVKAAPIVEGVLNLQFQVIPNVIADVSLALGYPYGVGGAVGFALAY